MLSILFADRTAAALQFHERGLGLAGGRADDAVLVVPPAARQAEAARSYCHHIQNRWVTANGTR